MLLKYFTSLPKRLICEVEKTEQMEASQIVELLLTLPCFKEAKTSEDMDNLIREFDNHLSDLEANVCFIHELCLKAKEQEAA